MQGATRLPEDLSDGAVSDIFDHHGWKVEEIEDDWFSPTALTEDQPAKHRRDRWRGMDSRGNPLYIGSPYRHRYVEHRYLPKNRIA